MLGAGCWVLGATLCACDSHQGNVFRRTPRCTPGGVSFRVGQQPRLLVVARDKAPLRTHAPLLDTTHLDEGLRWCDTFVSIQHSQPTHDGKGIAGWWDTGYSELYIADTGTVAACPDARM